MRIVVYLVLFLFAVAFVLALTLAIGTLNARGVRKLVLFAVFMVIIYFVKRCDHRG